MAYEQVGNGYSVGVVPNYAAEDEQIQQGLAHRFDQYTNPFLLAHNISDVFQPGIQNAQHQQQINSQTSYQQGMLGVEQARQQLAATAQDTLLPLQANMLTAQAGNIKQEGDFRQYQLTTAQNAQAAAQRFFQGAAQLKPGDTAGLTQLAADNSAFLATAEGQNAWRSMYGDMNQQANTALGFKYGAAKATGQALASSIPQGTSVTDWMAKNMPPPTGNDPTAWGEYNAKVEGVNQQYSGIQQATMASGLKKINIALQGNQKIEASWIGDLRGSIGTTGGKISPDVWAAANITDPAMQDKITALINADQPTASGNMVDDKTRVANMATARGIQQQYVQNPTTVATPLLNWANDALNTNGAPSSQLPTYTPETLDQIRLGQDEITQLQTNLAQNQKGIMWGAKDTAQATAEITQKKAALMKLQRDGAIQNQQPAQGAAAPNQSFQQSQNPFTRPIPEAPTGMQNTGSLNINSPGQVVQGNPLTTAADAATGGATTPAAASGQTRQAPSLPAADLDAAVAKMPTQWQQSYTYAIRNPKDPNSAKILEQVRLRASMMPPSGT